MPPLRTVGRLFDSPNALRASPWWLGAISFLGPEQGCLNVWVQPVHGGDARCVTHECSPASDHETVGKERECR